MKKYIFTITLIALLSGCDKWNDIVGRIKEKSPWVYSEETDKLNNSKIIKAKKDFKNAEGTVQADVEFQCSAGKVLILQIGTYQTKVVDGNHPGASLNFNSTDESEVDFVKTRTGENKIAFPILSDKEFNNIAKISLTGINMTGINGFTSLIKMMTANVEIGNQGYKLAADGKEIPQFFKTSDWVIEIPTANGKIVIEIDLANKDIQKVFEACSWKPEFSNTVAQAAATQSQMPSQTTARTEKTLIGKLISADEGDESCSLKILGQDKKEVQATATFELCTERFKVGKTYKFNYGATEVPDCDCQGNQACYANCKKTVTQIEIVDGTPLD
jgi:hypothetical protein